MAPRSFGQYRLADSTRLFCCVVVVVYGGRRPRRTPRRCLRILVVRTTPVRPTLPHPTRSVVSLVCTGRPRAVRGRMSGAAYTRYRYVRR